MSQVQRWKKPLLNAAKISVGVCKCGDLVGIDLCAADGTPFAHAHLDTGRAEIFWREYGEAIVEAKAKG